MIRINISFVLILLAFVSCSKKQSSNEGGDSSLTDERVMTAPLKLSSSSFTIESETDDEIVIGPCTPYYKEWMSNDRIELKSEPVLGYCDSIDYPIIDVYLTNNTDHAIVFNSLDFIVREIVIDDIPYIYLFDTQSRGEELGSNRILMKNESWSDWGVMHFDYSIMKRGESFDGTYKNRKDIPYFDDEYLVDFTQDLVGMGLDMSFLYENDWCPFEVGDYSVEELLNIFYPFEIEEAVYEYFVFARIYGKISFTKSNFTKEFYGPIYITPFGGGAADDFDDIFDVELDYDRRDYTVRFPYSTTLKPGDNESVRLTLKCPRSSNHKFYISINNDNGLTMRTKDVKMHYLNGRHSTKQPMFTQIHAD